MPDDSPRPASDIRLNGWKDIANRLGKGVRTVQRWEKLYGLPVHRIGQDGDIVFAYAGEIDRWLADFERHRHTNGHAAHGEAADDAEEAVARESRAASSAATDRGTAAGVNTPAPVLAPARRSATVWIAAVLLAVAVSAGLLLSALQAPSSAASTASARAGGGAPQPAGWRVEDDRLVVLDDSGQVIWTYAFGFDVIEASFTESQRDPFFSQVRLEDLDADGSREVVLKMAAAGRDERRLYVFNADGTVRFIHHPAPTVRFGTETYSPPWAAHGLTITRNVDGTKSIWVTFIHGLWFPTLLQQLDADGRVESEYWSNGYITSVSPGRWRGAPAVFVGGTNNETRGASLAIFAGTSVRGSAPTENATYRCVGCDAASPDAFLVFPRACLHVLTDEQADVSQAWEDESGTVTAIVTQGRSTDRGARIQLAAYYAIAPDLARASVELSARFVTAHEAAVRDGRLDHGLGARDRRQLLPVLRWWEGRFVPLAAGEMKP